MKTMIVASAIAFGLFACSNANENAEDTAEKSKVETVETNPVSYNIDTETSVISWKGSMIGVYAHEGTLSVSSGSVTLKDGAVTEGNFTVDMNSMVTTDDDALYEMAPREKLIGHLQSPDFFATEEFPTGDFKVMSVSGDVITGELTLKGVTKEATINSVKVDETDGSFSATGNLVFNRQDFGISYENTMNDMVLSDDIELAISILGNN